jgi:SAM-dependent methyltransferase
MKARWVQDQAATPDEFCRAPLFDLRINARALPLVSGATTFAGVDPAVEESLAARLNELPPPQERLSAGVLASSSADGVIARDLLVGRGYKTVHIFSVEDLYALAPTLLSRETALVKPSRALWSPSPTLLRCLPKVWEALVDTGGAALRLDALDLGAGSGRDAAFLASCGWHVTAVDRDVSLVNKAAALGNRNDQQHRSSTFSLLTNSRERGSVSGVVWTFGANLAEDKVWLRAHAASLLLVVRFLRHGVLEMLGEGVREGGFILYEHFLVGCELHESGPRKRSQMLHEGECRRIFGPDAGFDVLVDDIIVLADGRPCSRFLARKNGKLINS